MCAGQAAAPFFWRAAGISYFNTCPSLLRNGFQDPQVAPREQMYHKGFTWEYCRPQKRGWTVVEHLRIHLLTYQGYMSMGVAGRVRSYSSVVAGDYAKKNYAKDVNQYTDVLYNLNFLNRSFLLRDVYEDMLLDGIQPLLDTFFPLLIGCMKGARLQDAFFFYEEMKCMGLIPDDLAFNCLIATCGRCRQQRRAFQVVEEMMQFNIRPKLKTLTALLGACGAAGLPKEAAGVVQRITESGFALNKYCYAALVMAEKNQVITKIDVFEKIMELLKQSSSWSAQDALGIRDGGETIDDIDEYIFCLPTVDFVRGRRNIVDRRLTVYHAALFACADLKNTVALRTFLELLKQDGFQPDLFCVAQILRCHLACGEYNIALRALKAYLNSGRPARVELFYVFMLEAIKGYTREGMEAAKEVLQDTLTRDLALPIRMSAELLELASEEPAGDFSTANLLFDILQKRRVSLQLRTLLIYLRGLRRRQIPEGDPRLMRVMELVNQREQSRGRPQQAQLQS